MQKQLDQEPLPSALKRVKPKVAKEDKPKKPKGCGSQTGSAEGASDSKLNREPKSYLSGICDVVEEVKEETLADLPEKRLLELISARCDAAMN